MIKVEKATLNNLEEILAVIEDARGYLKRQNINQWQNGYPNKQSVTDDLTNKICFVFKDEEANGKVVACCCYDIKENEDYAVIYNGQWLNKTKNYLTIHRTAILDEYRGKGLSHQMIYFAEDCAKENNCESVRIDTHADNKIMQHIIRKSGFHYCGDICITVTHDPRLAFEKLL